MLFFYCPCFRYPRKDVTIGHNAIVHEAVIGDNVLIGMGAIIMNGANIGRNSIIGSGCVVTENQTTMQPFLRNI